MSGGSFNYLYSRMEQEYKGEMHDAELEELLNDFCNLLHDLEWWQSGDYGEDQYRESVDEFKQKWHKGSVDTNYEKAYKALVKRINDDLNYVSGRPVPTSLENDNMFYYNNGLISAYSLMATIADNIELKPDKYGCSKKAGQNRPDNGGDV